MQLTVEISEQSVGLLDKVSEMDKVTRAEVVQTAVADYLTKRVPEEKAKDWSALDAAFGIWKDGGEDALDYQKRIRGE